MQSSSFRWPVQAHLYVKLKYLAKNHISVEILTKNLIPLSLTTSEVSDIYTKVVVRLPGGSAGALLWSEVEGGDQSATDVPLYWECLPGARCV